MTAIPMQNTTLACLLLIGSSTRFAVSDETSKKEFIPIELSSAATIVSTKGMFFDERSQLERLVFKSWTPKNFAGVPFHLVDPMGDRVPNVIMLNGPQGQTPPKMPKQVSIKCDSNITKLHLLSGISGWGAKNARNDKNAPVSMLVRFHYEDGVTEDHSLYDGQHFADYIGRFDVPKSKFAFAVRNQQIRFLTVKPKRNNVRVEMIEFAKGQDRSAPIVVAATIEK